MRVGTTKIAELAAGLDQCEASLAATMRVVEDMQKHIRQGLAIVEVTRSRLEAMNERREDNSSCLNCSPQTADALVTIPELMDILGVARQTVWRLRMEDDFPRPVRVGPTERAIRYRRSDIDDWMRSR